MRSIPYTKSPLFIGLLTGGLCLLAIGGVITTILIRRARSAKISSYKLVDNENDNDLSEPLMENQTDVEAGAGDK